MPVYIDDKKGTASVTSIGLTIWIVKPVDAAGAVLSGWVFP
jgi:hypothetical protein